MPELMAWCCAASTYITLLKVEATLTRVGIDEHKIYEAVNVQAADVKDLLRLPRTWHTSISRFMGKQAHAKSHLPSTNGESVP
jgi:hypothetical protein